MTQPEMSCPKCDGEMANGYVIDYTYGTALVSQWAEGVPQKPKAIFGILTQPGIQWPTGTIPVCTFRCRSCGFLESYAREEFAAK